MTIASRVSAARLARDWTPRRLAEAAGVGVATLRGVERARFSVTLLTLVRIAGALDSGLDVLVRPLRPGGA